MEMRRKNTVWIDYRSGNTPLTKAKAQGMKAGEKQGPAKGRAEGFAKGLTKRFAKGLTKGLKKVALEMLKQGADIALIQQYTGLTLAEVKKLAKKAKP